MHILLALLYVSLVAAPGCTSLPTKGESIRRTRHNIVNIVQISLVHIKKLQTMLPASPQIEVTSPSIEGLTSICHDLGLLENGLQIEVLSQIQADVSSLEGKVRSLALTMECPVQAKPSGGTIDNLFPESYLYLILAKVQDYLEQLLLNKDKLKVC
ncbi:leptin-B-like [Lates calcarifer]|uniref:Leptin-B-like n=1 Tax=Lates calcarifer TaxID=8187 RepID=A0A4W6E586_LATCA|nr:leptin-B-like [Lates calcarifer]